MKITLSKGKNHGRRHVVLLVDTSEVSTALNVVRTEVLARGMRVVQEVDRRNRSLTKIRFSMPYLRDLLLAFPFAELSKGVQDLMSDEAQAELAMLPIPDLSRWHEDSDFNGTLWDFQKVAVERILRRKRFLLQDEMGLGKTYVAGASIAYKRAYPALCIVPNSAKYDAWETALEQYFDCSYAILDGTRLERESILQEDVEILVVNHEAVRMKAETGDWIRDEDGSIHYDEEGHRRKERLFIPVYPELFEKQWEMIVVDELHEFRNPEAQRTVGLHHLHAPQKLGMTGTMIVNGRPEEYWSGLHWLWPRRYPDYGQFVAEHCIRRGGAVVGYRGLKKIKDFIEEKNEAGKPRRSIRRRKEWIRDDLPQKIYVPHTLDMTEEQRFLYDEIEEDLRLRLASGEIRNINDARVRLTRLKQACFSPELYDGTPTSPKIDETKRIMEELVANGEKAIIFSEWKRATRIIERELAMYNPAYVDSTVSPKKRKEQSKLFNFDEDCKVFIGTIGSCKTAITLGAATYVIFTDLDWVPAYNDQAIGRSAAGGLRGINARSNKVHVIELKMRDSVEQRIDKVLAKKAGVNSRMTDRDAGAKIEMINMRDIATLLGAA